MSNFVQHRRRIAELRRAPAPEAPEPPAPPEAPQPTEPAPPPAEHGDAPEETHEGP